MLANQMFPAAMSIFMVVLVQDLDFPGWMWGVIFFAPRAFDSSLINHGFISDNTRSSGVVAGNIFWGAILMGFWLCFGNCIVKTVFFTISLML